MANEKTGRESDKFMLRMPDGMRDRIAQAAKNNGRSMNAEIVQALEEKYPQDIPINAVYTLLTDFLMGVQSLRDGGQETIPMTDAMGKLIEGLMRSTPSR